MKVLVVKKFFGDTVNDSLAKASVSLKQYAKEHKLEMSLKRFTVQNLNFKSQEYPEVHCKGYMTFVILRWLQWALEEQPDADVPELVRSLVWSANSLLSVWGNGDHFLTVNQQSHIQIVGHFFIRTYLQLAGASVEAGERLWRMRPKFHLLHHAVLEQRPSRCNQHFYATWMDEDAVKNLMVIKKRTHKLQATDRSIKRWLLGLRPKLEAVMQRVKEKLLFRCSALKHVLGGWVDISVRYIYNII